MIPDHKNSRTQNSWAFNIFPRKFHQTLKKFTSKKLMPKIFITTFSFYPKPEIFLWNKHTQTQKIINIFPRKSRFSFKPNTNRTSLPYQHLSLLLFFSPFSPQYHKNPIHTTTTTNNNIYSSISHRHHHHRWHNGHFDAINDSSTSNPSFNCT